MSNPNGKKGTAWETDNKRYLSRWWPKIGRPRTEGANDKGDLTHPEGWAVECKNAAPITLPKWLREAEDEARNKGVRWFVVLVKNRRSKGESGAVEDGYAVTRTRVWADVAYEHETAIAFAETVIEYADMANRGELSDGEHVVLIRQAIREYLKALEARTADG